MVADHIDLPMPFRVFAGADRDCEDGLDDR